MDLKSASIQEVSASVRSKKMPALEVTRFFLKRIQDLDIKLNSFISINEKAEEEARNVDKQIASGQDPGPLAGVPIAVKDLICTRGLRTTAASKMLKNFIPPYSATLVERLRDAGAVVLGKTNLDEFAMGSSNESSHFGLCKNPWNTEYVPGGSSGGSAAAMAARLALGAIGTDTGGSIRQPSSFCGLYGIKPTYGRVSRYGVIAFASSLDQAGPMAQSTQDCAALLQAMSGRDARDSTSSHQAVPNWVQNMKPDLKGIRIGLPKEYFSQKVDGDVERVVQNAIAVLRECGATTVDISLSHMKHAVPIYYLIAASEASSNLARYDGIRYGHRASTEQLSEKSIEELYSVSRGQGFGSEVKRRIMLGTFALSSGYYDAYYQKAGQVRRLLRDEFMQEFKKCDVILSPTTTSPAFRIGEKVSDPLAMYLNDIFTTSTNLAGLPGMSVPAGFSAKGLPIGVQLMGQHFDEQMIFNVSQALEENLNLEKRVPHVI